MSVQNGNLANETTFNTSFCSREEDTDTVGVLGLQNTVNVDSGPTIANAQRLLNELADANGTTGEGDATSKTYSSNNAIADGDDRKVAIGKLDATFHETTGHTHDGTAGNGGPIDISSISGFNNFFAEYQEFTFDAANGNSTDVSASFAALTPGGTSTSAGVLTSAPDNYIDIVGKDDYREVEDADGDRVYGRLTESSGTWTLTYFTNEAGTETAHSLSSQNIRYLYREVFTADTRPTIGVNVGIYDSLSAVEDIPDASATVEGKVNIATQSFSGVKNFLTNLQKNGVDVATISDAQTITNKILDGGVATNTRYWNVPAETTANLTALTRVAGAIFYSTDELTYYGDDGTNLIGLGGGAGGGLDSAYQENFESNAAADLTSGNSVTFAASGSLNGTLADEEVTPLSGDRSIKYTMGGSSTNDWFHLENYDVALKDRGKTLTITNYASYDGAATDVKLVVWDDTNSQILRTVFIDSSDIIRYSVRFTVPSNTAVIKIGYQVDVGNSGKILEFDNIEVSSNPFATGIAGNITQWEAYTPTNTQGFGTITNNKLIWRRVGESVEIQGSFNTGTVSAVEGQLELPNSYTVRTGFGVAHVSMAPRGLASSSATNQTALATGGDTYINFAWAGSNPLVPQNGNNVFASGNLVSLKISVPVNELSEESGLPDIPIRAHISEQQPQNTAGGTFTSGAWQTRIINTSDDPIINPVANQMLLTPGEWRCMIRCPAREVSSHVARLQNVTDNATLLTGSSGYTASAEGHDYSVIIGKFTLTSSKTVEVQHRCSATKGTNGFGVQTNITTETYTTGWLEKVS